MHTMYAKLASPFVLFALILIISCGSERNYQVQIEFVKQADFDAVARMSVWALEGDTDCTQLTAGSTHPIQYTTHYLKEIEFPPVSTTILASVPNKRLLFFAEARNQDGAAFLRGCQELNVGNGEMNVILRMQQFCTPTTDQDVPNNQIDDDCDGATDECDAIDTDTDLDGVPDCNDDCPNDPNKVTSGMCGCGVDDSNKDGDALPDCQDGCPDDGSKIDPEVCGCGIPDVDQDNNGVIDCLEECAGQDSDADGVCDPVDQCQGDDNSGDFDADGLCNDLDLDDDNDGWSDADEVACGTDPLQSDSVPTDTDGDGECDSQPDTEVFTVTPTYYDRALRNPLKGITTRGVYVHEWATLAQIYIRWNEIENHESDGLDKIISYSNQRFGGLAERNVKVIPRVYLHWDGSKRYWPDDINDGDYSSEQFRLRLIRLIRRLGQAWNNDPRVAFVEMGIFGKWGEQESPSPKEVDAQHGTNIEQTLGDEFTNAFPDKIVSVRHIWDQFPNHTFGEYWDSWAHNGQIDSHGVGIKQALDSEATYKTHYIGGEVAYNWGSANIQPGDSPDDTLQDSHHRDFMINTLRWLHCTQLRWIDDYDQGNAKSQAGAEKIQRVMGYRFVLEEVAFTSKVTDGKLRVRVSVKNEGSAPFYYPWPVEVSLLNTEDRELLWSTTFSNADVREWQPGETWTEPDWASSGEAEIVDGWSTAPLTWGTPPPTYQLDETFSVSIPAGTYVLALAVLDPAGKVPNLRFATSQYFNGGRHPIGLVAIGDGQGGALPDDMAFDDPGSDQSLHYVP